MMNLHSVSFVLLAGLTTHVGAGGLDGGGSAPGRIPARFDVCHGFGCSQVSSVTLDETQWWQIVKVFSKEANSPAEERSQIGEAIALFERIIGPMTGTDEDKGGNWKGSGLPGQMDCIDESANTTAYLQWMQANGLMRWHTVAKQVNRSGFFFLPHQSAAIQETGNHQYWAVDSWYRDNGEPPFILPLEKWSSGWNPTAREIAGRSSQPMLADMTN